MGESVYVCHDQLKVLVNSQFSFNVHECPAPLLIVQIFESSPLLLDRILVSLVSDFELQPQEKHSPQYKNLGGC